MTPTGKQLPIGAERCALDGARMTDEKVDLFQRRRIINPNTHRSGDGEPRTIRGICYATYRALTQARRSAIGQPHFRVIFGESIERKQNTKVK